jgi:hypothetical protein
MQINTGHTVDRVAHPNNIVKPQTRMEVWSVHEVVQCSNNSL